MIKKILYNVLSKSKIAVLKTGKNELNNLMFDIIDSYYSLLANKKIHENAISIILKEYMKSKESQDVSRKYIFSRKIDTDRQFEEKFGKKGRYMAELNKLIQIIYFLDNEIKIDDDKSTLKIKQKINKDFNKISLHIFEKYNS